MNGKSTEARYRQAGGREARGRVDDLPMGEESTSNFLERMSEACLV